MLKIFKKRFKKSRNNNYIEFTPTTMYSGDFKVSSVVLKMDTSNFKYDVEKFSEEDKLIFINNILMHLKIYKFDAIIIDDEYITNILRPKIESKFPDVMFICTNIITNYSNKRRNVKWRRMKLN